MSFKSPKVQCFICVKYLTKIFNWLFRPLVLTSLVGTTFFANHRPHRPVETLVDCTRSKVSFDRLTPSDVTVDTMIDVCPGDKLPSRNAAVISNDSSSEHVAVRVGSRRASLILRICVVMFVRKVCVMKKCCIQYLYT